MELIMIFQLMMRFGSFSCSLLLLKEMSRNPRLIWNTRCRTFSSNLFLNLTLVSWKFLGGGSKAWIMTSSKFSRNDIIFV